MVVEILITGAVGYLFGCLQSAYLVGRWAGGVDIREHGSGNAGASNITSTLGLKYGVIVGAFDILKGTLAVLTASWLFPARPDLAYASGLMAVVGHIFPVFLGFRGGKGVATLAGMMFGVNPLLGLLFVLLVAVPALAADYIVAGSLAAFAALPVVTYLRGYPPALMIAAVLLMGASWYLHRENIQRILAGEELKISSVLGKGKGES